VHEEMQAGEFLGLERAERRDVSGVVETDVRQDLIIVQGTQVRMVDGLGHTQLAEESSDEPYHLITRPPQDRGDPSAVGALREEDEHLHLDQRQPLQRPRGLAHGASVGRDRGVEGLEPRGPRPRRGLRGSARPSLSARDWRAETRRSQVTGHLDR
jgi:hypothetical protein